MDEIKCNIVEKTSKNGNRYVALEITLTPNYKKIVFLNNAELELLKLLINKKN